MMSNFEEEVQALRGAMQGKFAAFVNEDITLEQYQDALKSYQKNFPDEFAVIQQQNTDAKIAKLNELDFGDNVLGVDKSIRDTARNAMDVMYGVENDRSLWDQLKGVTSPEHNKMYVAGKAPAMTSLHEGLHVMSNTNNGTDNPTTGDELFARAMDYYRAKQEGNKERMASTLDYVGGDYTAAELEDIAKEGIKFLYNSNLAQYEAPVSSDELQGNSSFIDKLFNVFK